MRKTIWNQDHNLPIHQVIPDIKSTLMQKTSAVLVAEPGAGKTTVVPLALLEEEWMIHKKIIMLEPRRLAARNAAMRMAKSIGEPVGKTVGYRVRMDSKVSSDTRIEVVTEGILTRMLQHDQALEEVGLLIFDEFHERNLHGDLALALALECQSVLREDLRILVMSATLEAEPVTSLLGDAALITCKGRTFPVETKYMPKLHNMDMEAHMAQVIPLALRQQEGHVLAFLPGAKEIHRVMRMLEGQNLDPNIKVYPLYGALSQQEQDRAILTPGTGERKVILATTIAESSLTIEGIGAVVDSGLRKDSVFSSRSGMSRLVTIPISKASADQRKGRAGRTAEGICYRLWSASEQDAKPEKNRPEILTADLAPVALELAVWGVQNPDDLRWLDVPPAGAYEAATALLQQLGCLDDRGHATSRGKQIAGMGTHPRIGHMLLQAAKLGLARDASLLGALLQQGSSRLLVPRAGWDLRPQLEHLRTTSAAGFASAASQDEASLRSLIQESRQLYREVETLQTEGESLPPQESCGLLLAFAYPERIGQRREDGRYFLASGRGVRASSAMSGLTAPYIVVAEADDQGADGLIRTCAPLALADIYTYLKELISTQEKVFWDKNTRSVRSLKWQKRGEIILKEMAYPSPPEEDILQALLTGIREEGLSVFSMNKTTHQLVERMQFLHSVNPAWPDLSGSALLEYLLNHIPPYLAGVRSAAGLQQISITSVLLDSLSWEERQTLEKEAPTHYTVPSGSKIPIRYDGQGAPYIAVRLQEMFGLTESPRLGEGRVPLTLHLLSPAQRPVQVTSDLNSFWREGYYEVKKDLKGRYPKHYWPEDPLQAVATNRVKPKGK
ncbi:ATP-dependent helicase HrpB [Paenibacillus sp. J45TS6]|uniref:ATP-dependent helicase HrpB n=1 Tax=unclassified Paenibacillus TaxID=185978 RepID=UPI001B1BC675|nr:ATP-dependent helicase HrpB [Paenibacillus sp. J45TS6]GIP43869.1 ATP-dependent helicase HrpB [Paenibacillus sp. J45TS6]